MHRYASMYVYIQSEKPGELGSAGLWTVGFYRPTDGGWEPESDHAVQEDAAKRVAWLNGGPTTPENLRPTDDTDREEVEADLVEIGRDE